MIPAPISTAAYRPDIDGLRAIAVTSVVVFHAAPSSISGGFLGVDVFFVISGFLIGGLLLKELDSGKSVTQFFLQFYARRARRILPALIVVIAASAILGWLIMTGEELKGLATSSAAALLGASNVLFWSNTDYFGPASDQLPMLMTWSLGVEEQFYVLIPIIMLLLHRLGRTFIVGGIALVFVGSFLASLWLSNSHPAFAFYMLPTRAWELAAGVLLAVFHASRWYRPIAGRLADAASLAGLALLIAGFVLVTDRMAIPGLVALLPVVGTLLLINSQASPLNRRVLGSSAMVRVGLISYSWYLWHWPLMALVRLATPGEPDVGVMLFTAAVSAVLGYASWRWVEQPFRRRHSGSSSATVLRFGAAVAAVVAVLVVVRVGDGFPARLPPEALLVETVVQAGRGNCLVQAGTTELQSDAECRPTGIGNRIALIGDSHASALGPGLSLVAEDGGQQLVQMSKSSCPPLFGVGSTNTSKPEYHRECGAFLEAAIQHVESDPTVKTVVLAGYWPALTAEESPAFIAGARRTIDRLNKAGKSVILVEDVPVFLIDPPKVQLANFIGLRGAAARMSGPLEANRTARTEPTSRANADLETLTQTSGGAQFLSVRETFCDETCVFSDQRGLLFIDTHHLSTVGSQAIDWSVLREK